MHTLLVQLSTVVFSASLVTDTQASAVRGFTSKGRYPRASSERSEGTQIAGNGTDLASEPTPGGHIGSGEASAGISPGKHGGPAAATTPGGDPPPATASSHPPPPPPHPVPAPPPAAPSNPNLPGGPVVLGSKPPVKNNVDLSSSDQRKSGLYPPAFSVVAAGMVLALLHHR